MTNSGGRFSRFYRRAFRKARERMGFFRKKRILFFETPLAFGKKFPYN